MNLCAHSSCLLRGFAVAALVLLVSAHCAQAGRPIQQMPVASLLAVTQLPKDLQLTPPALNGGRRLLLAGKAPVPGPAPVHQRLPETLLVGNYKEPGWLSDGAIVGIACAASLLLGLSGYVVLWLWKVCRPPPPPLVNHFADYREKRKWDGTLGPLPIPSAARAELKEFSERCAAARNIAPEAVTLEMTEQFASEAAKTARSC